jgi:hypothetical protein
MEYLTEDDYKQAELNGINRTLLYRRFYTDGWSKEDAINRPKYVPPYTGWSDYKKLAKEHGVSRSLYHYRFKNLGMTPEEAATTPKLTCGRKRYFTKEQEETAKANGISYNNLYHRVFEHKWPIERAMTEPINKRSRGQWNNLPKETMK